MEGAKGDVKEEAKVLKPWKLKRREAQNPALPKFQEIEIYESKVVSASAGGFEITSPTTGYLCIQCQADGEFIVPLHVVEYFQCVDVILHGDGVFKENVEKVIRFPDIRFEVMESVLRFVFIEHLNNVKAAKYWGHDTPRLVFQFEVDPGLVVDLIYAAHFLGIKSLLEVAATMMAHHLADVPDVSSMPLDLAWCVAKQLTARELFDAEQRPDFVSLNLETDVLWEQHCKKFLQEDIVTPVLPTTTSYPLYDKWDNSEGPPPSSWKSLYIAQELQQLADRQDGGQNDAFFAEVAYKGTFAYKHTIRVMMWDWVMSAPKSLSLASYTALLPNLLSLILVNLPLGNPQGDNNAPNMSLGDILCSLPLLQHLDVSESGVTIDGAISLSKGLKSHTRLQVLRMAYNSIRTRGFSAIAMCLPLVIGKTCNQALNRVLSHYHLIHVGPSTQTLKLLDVRENGIAVSVPQEAVAAIEASALEELLLEVFVFEEEVLDDVNNIPVHANFEENNPGLLYTLQALIWSALPKNLKRLQLPQCKITDSQVTSLMRALNQHEIIQIINLSDNEITSTGACAIFTWLQGNGSLLELMLGNNNITDSSSSELIKALESHPCLEKISLKGNYSYGEENLQSVIQAAVGQGETLLLRQRKRFTLDLGMTDVSFFTRARIQTEFANFANFINLII